VLTCVVKVKNPVAINLLFLEAYHNYIKCLYPCANTDATVLAGILMQINNGDYDPARPISAAAMYDYSLYFQDFHFIILLFSFEGLHFLWCYSKYVFNFNFSCCVTA